MFLGEHQHTLDAKGRVSLPAKFRSQMPTVDGEGTKVVLVKGLEGCLYAYTTEQYEKFVARLLDRDDFDGKARQIRRFFLAGAVETELDSAGRVSIPSVLREYAKLSKNVNVNGVGERIEIWDSAAWAAYDEDTTDNIEDLAQAMAAGGLA